MSSVAEPRFQDDDKWLKELDELLASCSQSPNWFPTCPPDSLHWRRFCTTNLAFEAILSLFDNLPTHLLAQAIARAEKSLAELPPLLRQQWVEPQTFAALLDSPGWPLVRGLVLNPWGDWRASAFLLHDSRLLAIERIEIPGDDMEPVRLNNEFSAALLTSHALVNVTSFSVGAEVDKAVRIRFAQQSGRAEFAKDHRHPRLEKSFGASRIEKCVLKNLQVQVPTQLRLPMETLILETDLSAVDIECLVNSNLLVKVQRLEIHGTLDDSAAKRLAQIGSLSAPGPLPKRGDLTECFFLLNCARRQKNHV